MATFIEVEFASGVTAFQEVSDIGEVVSYRNPSDGSVLPDYPPVDVSCHVTNAEPTALDWMSAQNA